MHTGKGKQETLLDRCPAAAAIIAARSQIQPRRETNTMKITITGRKVNLRDSFKDLVNKKLSKFEKFFGDEAEANVTVTLEKNRQKVEITVRSKGYIYRAEQTSEEMNDALDIAIDHLSRQIRKNKTRLDKRLKADKPQAVFEPLEVDQPEIEEESEFQIIRSKKFPVSAMDIDEAILQMNMLGHEFFMFRNDFTKEINVVYRREDGGYGLLEPEN